MGFFDKVRGEFIDIIEWTDDSRDTIVWRFPRYENEIKMGAKLTVRESQVAVFVNEGQVADAFPPGMYTLQTQNMPVLSTIKGWKHGFNSPFKAEVYFVNTRQFTDLKWGTQNPVIVRDPEFGMVRLRAFGGYALRVIEPVSLLRELAGTDPAFRTEEVSDHIRQMIIGKLGPALASSGVPMLDLVTHQEQIGDRVAVALNVELRPLGIEISRFIVENVSVPPEVEAMIDKRTQMGIAGNLDQYAQFQAANAMEQAAQNDGGAGAGMGMGMGMALGQQAAAAAQQPPQAPQPQAAPAGPPPLPPQEQWYLGANGQQLGPFDFAALGQQVANGTLTPDTLVWKQGMPEWAAARQVPALGSLFGQLPPPLPPQA
ncbi:SPFH domain-containing protein [Saccharopolyspora hirsuta]|uniref:SPFH domain-containing protein n=1 Tax=Saccharopolyspora hirsuta TaxID=1837 RepID=A0A5M7BXE9_SACHI|nr:SPFH domain-containing protein [Saccharopolyspora hirsuta]KAA5834926.1 SPFH domain-containing protein [Saccharopolyspora hirsuta]